MYFGELGEYGPESVGSNVVLAVSTGRPTFTDCGDVWTDNQLDIQFDDEIFLVAAFMVRGGTRSTFSSFKRVLNGICGEPGEMRGRQLCRSRN